MGIRNDLVAKGITLGGLGITDANGSARRGAKIKQLGVRLITARLRKFLNFDTVRRPLSRPPPAENNTSESGCVKTSRSCFG